MTKPDNLKLRTSDRTERNFAALSKLFPNAVTETVDANGAVIRAIDADVLRQEINTHVVEGKEERYQFTWPDKKKSVLLANAPIAATLRPCRKESVNFDTTENLYIEGDNLDVLKLLQETYLNRIKMIYIDPPYNTGNDFIYDDDFAEDSGEFLSRDGQYDEDGNRMVRNLDSNGRFHTDWLNMIYPRLRLARDLLKDDGVIFISIDDNEVYNLRKMCNEIFGGTNFVADLVWANKEGGGSSDSKLFRIKHEHILCFSKNIENVDIKGLPVGNEERYKSSDAYVSARGKYYLQKMGMGTIQYSKSLDYPITTPDGTTVMPADNNNGRKACWRWSKPKFEWGLENGFIEMKKDNNGIWIVYSKQYLNCDNEGNIITRTQCPMGIIDEYSSTQAAKLLENMGLGSIFSYAKPVELIRYLCERMANSNDTFLDFFSGSATTAHAVMQLNAEDGGKRKFIMVQLPETTDNKEYPTICEIGKERIRRAGAKIGKGDIGFRVLKLDSSNMKDVYYTPQEYTKAGLDFDGFVDNIKSDRTAEDLLFQVMLDLGIPLSSNIEVKHLDGKQVYYVNGCYLIACFESVDDKTVTTIAQGKPYYAVFRDSSFASDSILVNFEQIFKTYSPTTIRKVL
ncbi:DNA methylase N-4 [Spirochaetia bacterium]|nr:DNA methylase N-4 [Spirochaetia bacterium]